MEANNVEEINKDLQELYDVVSKKISLSIADGQFTTESLDIILTKIVETIEELSKKKNIKLSGIEKRNIGLNLLKMVLKDLNKRGQIDDHLYSSITLSLTLLSPVIFYAAKEAFKKLTSDEGCGCFSVSKQSRQSRQKRKNK